MTNILKKHLFIILILFSFNGQAQETLTETWKKTLKISGGTTTTYSSTVDKSGNNYVTGGFTGTVKINLTDQDSESITSNGNYDIFILKIDSDGNFLWIKSLGDKGNDIGLSISTDTLGNSFVTGYFNHTVDFDASDNIYNLSGSNTNFILKLDPDGNFIWVKSLDGNGRIRGNTTTTDKNGDCYISGYFTNTIDFNPGNDSNLITSNGKDDIFILKLDSDGNFIWVRSYGGNDSDRSSSISLDDFGNCLITGYFNETINFEPDNNTDFQTSNGNSDIFLLKIDSDGNTIWKKVFGGSKSDIGYGVDTDRDGNCYVTGYFYGTVDFNPSNETSGNITSDSYRNIFILKLNKFGEYQWVKSFNGIYYSIKNIPISVDALGNSYLTGFFYGTVDFDPSENTRNKTSQGIYDIFILKLSSDGVFSWVKQIGGAGDDSTYTINTDSIGNTYILGKFSGTLNFDSNSLDEILTSTGGNENFIMKVSKYGEFSWAKIIEGNDFIYKTNITTDIFGNSYTLGKFNGNLSLDENNGVSIINEEVNNGSFLLKLDSEGNYLWTKYFVNTISIQSISTDHKGNCFISGSFNGQINFEQNNNKSTHTSNGSADIFVLKLNKEGDYQWSNSMGGESHDTGYTLNLDNQGNSYLTGEFMGTVDFDPSEENTAILSSVGYRGIYTLKLDSEGNLIWVNSTNGNYFRESSSYSSIDSLGNSYLIGGFFGTVDFDPSENTSLLTSEGNDDIFIMKLDKDGAFMWVKSIEGSHYKEVSSIATNQEGNSCITGRYRDTIKFISGENNTTLTSNGDSDIFILKLDSEGNLNWAKSIGNTGNDQGYEIQVDNKGNSYTFGSFSGTVNFDTGNTNFSLSDSIYRSFMLKLDHNGDFKWLTQTWGNFSLSIDNFGNKLITGSGSIDYHPETKKYNQKNYFRTKIFIQKTGTFSSTVGCINCKNIEASDNLSIYPNPTKDFISIENNERQIEKINVFNALGKIVKNIDLSQIHYNLITINLKNLPSGIYNLGIIKKGETTYQKIIVTK